MTKQEIKKILEIWGDISYEDLLKAKKIWDGEQSPEPVQVDEELIEEWSLKHPAYIESGYSTHEFLRDFVQQLLTQKKDNT